jgi:hypothetical protein
VNIQSNVIHRFHGGASLVSLNQRPLSSAFVHQALLLRPMHSNLPSKWNYFLVTNNLVGRASSTVRESGRNSWWNFVWRQADVERQPGVRACCAVGLV